MNFLEIEEYLYSLGNEVSAMKLGLENIRMLLDALGAPYDKYLKVQVAGTNGKGSVCAFLDSICLEAGIKTGVFTSPHLVSITERIRIGGRDISGEGFARFATIVREKADGLLADGKLNYRPTFFEQMTAIALLAFADAGVQLAILETGLGGRLDATTAANAEIAAITRIDLDHQEYLGETIEQIAAEKAAIIHAGSKVVVAEQNAQVARVIIERCNAFGITPILANSVRTTCGSGWLKFETDRSAYDLGSLGLAGRHQIENAKAAILLAEILEDHFPITSANIADGLRSARHPGRLESQGRFLFDGAHNASGAVVLRAYLDEFVDRPVTLVFGAMLGKDIAPIADALFARADILILTQPANSRAMTAAEIAEHVSSDNFSGDLILTESVADALRSAERVTPDGGIILITGSLYLVGEAKSIISK